MRKLLFIILLPVMSLAEPGPASRYLSSEPATLLDIGMVRLQIFTTEFKDRVGLHWTNNEEPRFFRAEVHASYEPDDDKFYVFISAMHNEPNAAQMAEGCENAMAQMNIWLLKSLPKVFLHTAYDSAALPPDFYQNLTAMFEIRCSFSAGGDLSASRFWATRTLGLLGDRQMKIGKWKMRNE